MKATFFPAMRGAFLLVVSAALAACGERARPAEDDPARGIEVDPGTPTGRIALELWQLRPGVGLGSWSAANLNDLVSPADTHAVAGHFGAWCAVATRRFEAGGRDIERRAYFYAPAPPPDRALPDSADPGLVRDCELGLMWISVAAADSASLARFADSLRSALEPAFGPGGSDPVHFWGAAFWSLTARFRGGDAQVVTALRAGPARSGQRGPQVPRADVVALAFLPASGVSLDREGPPTDGSFHPLEALSLDSAVRLARLDSSLSAPLLAQDAGAGDPGRAAGTPAPGLVGSLRRWLLASEGLAAPRRAAALYAADRVLARNQCSAGLCEEEDSAALAPLRALGATFAFSPLGRTWIYERTWLARARALDGDGELGRRILLEQLDGAFDFSGTCAGGADAFRRVIENGESYLERVPASPVAAEVHFLVGEAHRDVAALAAGAGGVHADSSRYLADAPAARESALRHYRAAIAADAAGAVADAAWRRAWWLLSTLPPRGLRFYCVYD